MSFFSFFLSFLFLFFFFWWEIYLFPTIIMTNSYAFMAFFFPLFRVSFFYGVGILQGGSPGEGVFLWSDDVKGMLRGGKGKRLSG